MLKVRASLEEKLKQTGVLSSIARKNEKRNKRSRLLNGYQFASQIISPSTSYVSQRKLMQTCH